MRWPLTVPHLVLIAAVLALPACGKHEDPAPRPIIDATVGTYEFTVRGAFLSTDPRTGTVVLRNEAIPEYPVEGAEPGLDPADVTYLPGEGFDPPTGLEPGRPVEFRFSVHPDDPEVRTLLELTPLDASVELDFACLPRDYTVRGEVDSLPSASEDYLRVRHEPLPEYRAPDGKLGMPAMTMAFPTGDGVSLEGLEPGDKVSITFRVIYKDNHHPLRYFATRIEELPADTELDFSALPEAGAGNP